MTKVDGVGSTEPKVIVACGALALHIDQIAKRRGWDLEVRPIPPELHNRPEKIRAAVDAAGKADVVAYADCGTRGALDDLPRLAGADCYQLFGGMEHELGTYYLTDFLVRSFDRVVWLAQSPTDEFSAKAEAAAASLGLPLEVRETGDTGLEHALEQLLEV
jgi:hypothetical protein